MSDKIDRKNFEILLNWLGDDLEEGAMKYEKFHRILVKMFINRGCLDAETLADVTIDRVADKVEKIKDDYKGEKLNYFLGVARQVALEYYRSKSSQANTDEIDENKLVAENVVFEDDDEEAEIEIKCLKKCLRKLSADKREIVLNYFDITKGKKKEHHRKLQKKYSITSNNLKNQVYRLKKKLFDCVQECKRGK